MKKNSKLSNLIFILITGMGNLKQGNWKGSLIYFSAIILFGVSLILIEQGLIEKYYQPSQTMRTFAILLYIAFAFFWNGTRLLNSENKNRIFDLDEDFTGKEDKREVKRSINSDHL